MRRKITASAASSCDNNNSSVITKSQLRIKTSARNTDCSGLGPDVISRGLVNRSRVLLGPQLAGIEYKSKSDDSNSWTVVSLTGRFICQTWLCGGLNPSCDVTSSLSETKWFMMNIEMWGSEGAQWGSRWPADHADVLPELWQFWQQCQVPGQNLPGGHGQLPGEVQHHLQQQQHRDHGGGGDARARGEEGQQGQCQEESASLLALNSTERPGESAEQELRQGEGEGQTEESILCSQLRYHHKVLVPALSWYWQPWRQILILTGASAELKPCQYDEKPNWRENRRLFRLLEIFFSGENEPASKPLIFVHIYNLLNSHEISFKSFLNEKSCYFHEIGEIVSEELWLWCG